MSWTFFGSVFCSARLPVLRQARYAGIEASKESAFVLVAGGLGERLGYSGIKIALPADLASNHCFLQVSISVAALLLSLCNWLECRHDLKSSCKQRIAKKCMV
jgi:UDP-N-acetylglucosamine pyrophosphorylase